MKKLWALIQALKAGNSLRKPVLWKNVDALGKTLGVLIYWGTMYLSAKGMLPKGVPEELAISIGGGLATVFTGLSVYWGYATSEQVGWGRRELSEQGYEGWRLDKTDQQEYAATDSDFPPGWESFNDSDSDGGVLFDPRVRQAKRLPPRGAAPYRHPGDDPGLEDFNR
jgi:hypothetical protein